MQRSLSFLNDFSRRLFNTRAAGLYILLFAIIIKKIEYENS